MKRYIVSAIVSTYNSALFLDGRLKNLLEQTIADQLEIIIINSGSEQNERNIVEGYLNRYDNIKYIETEERETIYKAWNRGIKNSSGKYITNANTDDRLRKDALEILVNYLESNPEVGLVYADQLMTSQPNVDFQDIEDPIEYIKPNFSKYLFLQRCVIGSQPIWRADIHRKYNIYFNEAYEVAGDYEFEYQLWKKYKIVHISDYLGVYYKSPNNSNKEFESFDKTFQETYNLMKMINKENINSIAKQRFLLLQIYLEIIVFLPNNIYRLLYRIVKLYFPKYEINSLEYLYWLLSLIYESKGKLKKSKLVCDKYLTRWKSLLLLRRIEELS